MSTEEPPTNSTWPEGNNAAVCRLRSWPGAAARDHVPVTGSYSPAVADAGSWDDQRAAWEQVRR
ncbi:hypothetical protein ACN28S_22130 [Cystobacter fuscus]